MKRNFLLLLLLTLLPLVGWAQPSGVATAPVLATSPITWDGSSHQLITTGATTVLGYQSTYAGGNWNTGGWGPTYYNDAPAGIQYYVQAPGEDAPVNGNSGNGGYWSPYTPAMNGFTDITEGTATAPGLYTVWYRVMRDHNSASGNYQTSNWTKAGEVNIKISVADMPYYISGPTRKTDLVYNDGDQELITAGTEFCTGYDQANGGVKYVVKTTHGLPTAAEEATATTTIPTGKNAGTYYVYYKVLKDGYTYSFDSPWSEVGVGGIEIKKRDIKAEDVNITYATSPLTFKGQPQTLASFAWVGSPRGSVTYTVQRNEETPVTGLTAQGTNVGDYKVTVKIAGDANHNDFVAEEKTITIQKADYTVSEPDPTTFDFTYDGTPQGPLSTTKYVQVSLAGAAGSPWNSSSQRIEYSLSGEDGTWVTDPTDASLKATNAGTYTIYYRTKEATAANADFNAITDGELQFTIKKATWTVTTPSMTADWEYDANTYPLLTGEVTATGAKTTDVSVVKYYINRIDVSPVVEGNAIDFADVKDKDAGEYEVFYTVDEATNYNAVAKTSIGTVTVSKHGIDVAAQAVSVNWTGTPVAAGDLIRVDPTDIPGAETLTAEDIAAALAGFKDGEFKENDGTTVTVVTPIPSDAGNYTYVLETKENNNYEVNDFVPNGTLTIVKIDATAADVTAATLEYNGADQELLDVDDTPMEGVAKMLYFLDENGEGAPNVGSEKWSEDVPTAKNAGEYDVYFMAKGDKNHKDVAPAKVAGVEIAQKPLTLAMFKFSDDDMKAVFTGSTLMPTFTAFDAVFGTTDENALADADYTVKKKNSKGEVVTDMIDVDIYTFTIEATADGNYSGTLNPTFEIEPKQISDDNVVFALETASVPYDGKNHKADVVVVPTAPLTANDYDVVVPAEIINAGEYTITLTGKRNYCSTATATFTVTQAENEVTVDIEGWTYAGAASDPVNDPVTTATFAGTDEPKIEYAKVVLGAEPEFGTYADKVNGQAGNYIVRASVKETINWAAASATKTFVIAKAESKVTAPTYKANLTYNGLDQALLTAGAVVPEDGKVTYTVEALDIEDSEDIPVAKNVGVYVVKTTYTPDANHLDASIEDITVEIHPVVLTYTLANVEKTWDGEKLTAEQVDKLTGNVYGELQADDEYNVPFDLYLPEEVADVTNAGTYPFTNMVVKWKDEAVQNYNIKFSGQGLITINKDDIKEGDDFTAPEAVELTFDGKAHDLVTKGEVTSKTAEDYADAEVAGKPFGTVLYATAEDGEYSETIPQGTDADDYSVWYYVKGDKNHNDTDPVEVKNTIDTKAWTAVLDAFGDETTFEAIYTGSPVLTDAELVLFDDKTELEKDKDYTLDINYYPANETGPLTATELTNVGKYTLTYTGIGNYDKEANKNVYTVIIKQQAITAEAPKAVEGLKYNAAEQTLITAGKPSFGTMVYSLDGQTYAEALPQAKNAGTYTVWYKVDGDDNHTALAPAKVDVSIATLPVIVTAPNATKEFNGIAGLEGAEVGEFVYNGVLANDKIELAGEVVDYLIVKDAKADKGTYTIQVVEDAFNDASKNYEITATIDGTLTIEASTEEVTVNVVKDFKFTKVYGDAAVVSVPSADNLEVEGAVASDVTTIKASLKVDKNDYDENVGLQKGAYSLAAAKNATVFDNYANVTFGTIDMDITKAPLIVSIKAQEKTYDGKPATIEINDDAIGDMIAVEGLKFDDTAAILSGKLTATVGDGNAIVVGEYNISLEGELDNYEITPILGTYNITKATVTATLKAQKVQQGKELENAYVVEPAGIAEGDEDFFFVTADGLVDMDNIVTGAAGVYADALTLTATDDVIDNYEFDVVPAELEIIDAAAIVLADNEDWTSEAQDGVNVTFADRAINAGNWNVVALPFAATVKQISDAFGYAAVDVLNEGASDGNIHFQLISSGTVPAYTPFIVKTTEDKGLIVENFNDITFMNVNIEAWPAAKNSVVKDAAQNEFIGTFMANTEIPAKSKEYWYMSKGTWFDTMNRTKAVNLKAFRAYVHFDPANVAAGARIFIEEPDGTETAIDAVEFNNMVNGDTYTVGGMKVNKPAQKGIYIQNGKKIAVK
jgi:hypothetical protein